MYRKILGIAALLASTAAYPQVGGPPIGYVKGSTKGDAIYLVYPDGTGLTKVYQAPSRGRSGSTISRISIMPGGGAVALIQDEVFLRVQRYGSNGQPDGAAYDVNIPSGTRPCAIGDVDFRSDGALVVSDGCLNVWTAAPGATAASLLFTASANISAVRWMLDGSVLFQEGQLGSMMLKQRHSTGEITVVGPTSYFPPHIGMSRIGPIAALSDTQSFHIMNLRDGSTAVGCILGGMVQLSPDQTQILYRSPGSTTSSSTLFVHKFDCSGAPFRLATKGAYRAVAWRGN
jgi:hypothetical protein